MSQTLDPKGIWEQLYLLREMTKTTGGLFEAQILQLKMWGRLAAPHQDNVEFTWSNDRKKDKSITYNSRGEGSPPDNHSEILAGLDRSVKDLLGSDWAVNFYDNGQPVLNSSGKPIPEQPVSK